MTPTEIERLVRVEVIMDEVRDDLKALIKKIDDIDKRVRVSEEAIVKAHFGWRILLTLGTGAMTVAGAVGALMAKYLPFFSTLPR